MNINALVVFVLCIALSGTLDLERLKFHRSWQYLPKESCGYGITTDKIIGGIEAGLGQFPWLVRLIYSDNKTDYYGCAGSIINRWHVLTAAHCNAGVLKRDIKSILVGENFMATEIDCEGDFCAPKPVIIPIEVVINHYVYPKRITATALGDIAVVRTKSPIIFNDFIRPICLPTDTIIRNIKAEMSLGTEIQVAGWGLTDAVTVEIPSNMMHVTMPVVSLNDCRRRYTAHINYSQICIGESFGKDSCVGDSGGPAMKAITLDGPPKYYLMGIVSYGARLCGTSVAIYTNVTYYMDWILDQITK
ncbi:spaetzle-processing enzyme-like [Sitophilus oryzae]|uniref:Spaetzle-processing enzyme-like n=1 Tax=Sitophilus oryzae TaxID=7048 RepID=A0A6J2YL10_SITOR|nr:spaetzle-processing enzyme-like [Sitophilus oryzae]